MEDRSDIEWKDLVVDGVKEGMYMISNYGDLYSKVKKRNMSVSIKLPCGYRYVTLQKTNGDGRGYRVHRLVALHFVPNDDPENNILVGHNDNDKAHNYYKNLYWTTNQENTQRAVDDGLNIQPSGVDNKNSKMVKVVDLDHNLVAVYGSMRECDRMIENIDITYLMKMVGKNLNYKARNKFYKYCIITKEEYDSIPDEFKNIKLVEKEKCKKQCRVFRATNKATGKEYISDNQKRFGLEHGIPQACISNCLINGGIHNDWAFEVIRDLDYTETTGYQALVDLSENITIQNIYTDEIMTFETAKALKDYFGFNCHSLDYNDKKNLICSKWKFVS